MTSWAHVLRCRLIQWQLRQSRRAYAVLRRSLRNDEAARRLYPMHRQALDQQIIATRAAMGKEQHRQADLAAKLSTLK